MANRCFGPTGHIAPFLDHGITRFFLKGDFIDQGDKIIAEYVWIGGTMQDVRSKARTLPEKAGGYKPEELPHWNYGAFFCFRLCCFSDAPRGHTPKQIAPQYKPTAPPPKKTT